MLKDEELVTISVSRLQELLDTIDKYEKSLEKIERYTYFEINGLEFIRDEAQFALDKL